MAETHSGRGFTATSYRSQPTHLALWLFTLNYIVPHTTVTTDLWCHNHAHLNLKFDW